MAVKVFFHICAITRAYSVVDEMIQCILNSGLYREAAAIHCYISGDQGIGSNIMELVQNSGSKFCITKFKPGDKRYERLTLEDMHNHVDVADKVLYIHSKGVSQHHIDAPHRMKCVDDWRRMIMYFLVGRFRECLSMLDSVQTVGVNERTNHWNGNFWWVRGDYLLSLPHTIGDDYFDPEQKFLFLNNPTFKAIYNSKCPQHYEYRYAPANYV